MTIGDLTYSLGAVWDKKSLQTIKEGFASVSKAFMSAVGIASGAMAGTFAVVKQFAEANDELGKMARNRDIAVDSLQALQYSFEGAGLSASKAGDTLAKLQEQKEGFKMGKADYEAWARIGINPEQYSNTEDFFNATIDGLKNIKDEATKADLAKRLLGSADMKNLIDGGSEAIQKQKQELEELGVLTSKQDYKASANFNDTLLKTTTILKGLANKIMTSVMPVFTKLMKQFNEFLKANNKLIKSGLKEFFDAVVTGAKFFFALIGRIIGELGGMKNVLIGIAGLLLLWQFPLIASIGAVVALMLIFDDLMSFLNGEDSVIADWLGVKDLEDFKNNFPIITSLVAGLVDILKQSAEGWKLIFTEGDKALEGLGILIDRWLINPIKEALQYIEDLVQKFVDAKNAVSGGLSNAVDTAQSYLPTWLGGTETKQPQVQTVPVQAGGSTTTYNINAQVDAKNKSVSEAITEISHPSGYKI